MSQKIALLIDAENISHKDLPRILDHVQRQGKVILKAIYGDWQRHDMQPWHMIAVQYDFTFRHQTNLSHTKNSADMRLMMDAMEVLFWIDVDIFCLVSNDADYIPLCEKIHESGKYVIGIGYHQASDKYIRSFDQFIFLRRPQDAPSAPQANGTKLTLPSATTLEDVQTTIAEAFALAPHYHGWASLSALGSALREVESDFQTSAYGHATLSKLLRSMPDVVELRTHKNSMQARIKNRKYQLMGVRRLILTAFIRVPDKQEGWVSLSALGTILRQIQPSFQPNHYGHASLSKLLRHMPEFVELETRADVLCARLKTE